MTKEELAARLNGREYGSEITPQDESEAKASGLVIVFGAMDDLVEFGGAILDEVGAYGGATIKLHRKDILNAVGDHECDCKFCGYHALEKQCATIEALWCKEGEYSWTFRTDLPHATFEVIEDGKPFCRGIVIDTKDLPELTK